ncbi:MAG: pyruvate dehydrogenase (acetyl-transferring) E1 component subunit alpha [Alphaproteobacteria bacterium]|jgi:pyruvate dehydrogenase E1 component alpha subunit|nr:pyruvate dehydrogenase (acetyl-transferring) E1 component subunit alpha [Alphaproteobacteria bacterium]
MASGKKAAAKTTAKTGAAHNSAKLLQYYRDMLLIRRFEEKAGQLYGMGLIGGFCHLYIGQEAVVVGLQDAITPEDSVVTSYRDHGHMLACGMEARGVMAELTGRATGYSRGKGGSMHMFSREKNFYGGHGIVGAQVPIGTGIAFSYKYRNKANVCLAYMGDGAVNQGQVYEALNMAALWKLPVIYVIENNQYGMGTSVARASANVDLYRRGEGFGVPGVAVDGMDVMAVNAAAQDAVAYVKAGNGPFIMEMKTYRYRGHSMSDPAKYRSKEELEKMKTERDPIARLKIALDAQGVTEAEFKAIDTDIKAIVADAAEFAQTSPEPDVSELWTDILVDAA